MTQNTHNCKEWIIIYIFNEKMAIDFSFHTIRVTEWVSLISHDQIIKKYYYNNNNDMEMEYF
jgi:hypothetical protein